MEICNPSEKVVHDLSLLCFVQVSAVQVLFLGKN